MAKNASTSAGFAAGVVDDIVDVLCTRVPAMRRPRLIGLSGLQGSGKSTLAAQLCVAAGQRGIDAHAISLDDVYLSRARRQELARTVHPLLVSRGVPGTHDQGLLHRVIDALAQADVQPVRLPRFDKGRDARRPDADCPRVSRAPQWIFLEGWCVAVPPQEEHELLLPVNALEREHDGDDRWRRWVNTRLAQDYVPLWQRLDYLVWLAAADFAQVRKWREEPEIELREQQAEHAMSPAQLRFFIDHFERLGQHSLRSLPSRAQLRLDLDEQRGVTGLSCSRTGLGSAN